MIDEKISRMFGYDFEDLKKYIDDWKPVKELEWLNSYDGRRYIREITEDERPNFDRGWLEFKEAKPELKISYQDFVENKIEIDGQKRKLFKYVKDEKLSELVGKYKLPKTKLYLVISTNFDDFILCTTGNPWTACTNLEEGDFRYTTLGNIFMQGRFICYVTDKKPKSYGSLESYNMFYRCFGFVNESGEMVANIWYPTKNYMAFSDEHFKSVKATDNKKSKYGFDKVFNKLGFFIYPYLDYSVFDSFGQVRFMDDYLLFTPFVEFEDGKQRLYSSMIKFNSDGKNDDGEEFLLEDMMWRFCDDCGTFVGNIRTFGKKNYCPDCCSKTKETCNYCGKKKNLNNLSFTEDNTWVCSDCVPNVYKRSEVAKCSHCGTLVRKKEQEYCRFCRAIGRVEDAFLNSSYDYLGKNGNLYSYYRHFYMSGKRVYPPGVKYDEAIFEETEKLVER